MNAFQALFGWPTGGVYGNFVDDIIVGLLIGYFGRRMYKSIHSKLDRHHQERKQQATEQHEIVLAHVSAQVRQAATGEVDGMCQGVTKKHRACRNPAVFGTSRCRVHKIGIR